MSKTVDYLIIFIFFLVFSLLTNFTIFEWQWWVIVTIFMVSRLMHRYAIDKETWV